VKEPFDKDQSFVDRVPDVAGDRPRGFLTAELRRNGMKVTLFTIGYKEGKEHELTWRNA